MRADLAASGPGQWGASPAQASQLLCAWNAFALQTLGEELIDADYRAAPGTVGFLPPATAEQAAAFLGEVEHWSSRARRAARDPRYDVTAECTLPSPLPNWVKAKPLPQSHLKAMMAAAQAMRGHAEAALADLIRTDPPSGKQDAAARLRGMASEADSIAAYGEALWSPDAGPKVHEQALDSLRRGIDAYFEIGQLLAMPAVADQRGRRRQAGFARDHPRAPTVLQLPLVNHLPGTRAGQHPSTSDRPVPHLQLGRLKRGGSGLRGLLVSFLTIGIIWVNHHGRLLRLRAHPAQASGEGQS